MSMAFSRVYGWLSLCLVESMGFSRVLSHVISSLVPQCLENGEALSPAPPDQQPVLRLQERDHPRVALHGGLLPGQAQALLQQCC